MWFSTVGLIITLSLNLLVVPHTADAQQPVKVSLIGEILSGSPPSEAWRQPGLFEQALRELGWIEGQNIAFERRYAEEQLDRLADLAAELVRLKPDVIIASGTRDVLAAKQATTTIPIVITGAGMWWNRESSRAWRIPVATLRAWKTIPPGSLANV